MSIKERVAAGRYFVISNHTFNAYHYSVPVFKLTIFQNKWNRIIQDWIIKTKF